MTKTMLSDSDGIYLNLSSHYNLHCPNEIFFLGYSKVQLLVPVVQIVTVLHVALVAIGKLQAEAQNVSA